MTLSLTSTRSTPKNGLMGNPGLGVESSGAGRGPIITPPVSTRVHIIIVIFINLYIYILLLEVIPQG